MKRTTIAITLAILTGTAAFADTDDDRTAYFGALGWSSSSASTGWSIADLWDGDDRDYDYRDDDDYADYDDRDDDRDDGYGDDGGDDD
ncbi:MAG: hypothetical protein AAFY38_13840 [Pseudomonadota bacterium]